MTEEAATYEDCPFCGIPRKVEDAIIEDCPYCAAEADHVLAIKDMMEEEKEEEPSTIK